jgi:cell division septation protein DedD
MAIYIEILEVGSNVVVSGSGSANTASLTSNPTSDQGANIIADISLVTLYGSVNSSVDSYTGLIATHPNIGPGNGGPNYSFNRTGDNSFGISEQGSPTKVAYLYLPTGYISNSDLGTSTATYTNKSFTTLGLSTGTYTWAWGSGGTADSLTIQIGPAEPTPTPTPTSTATPTPTPSSTPTPTPTSTSTPTPTPSSSPVTTTTTTEPMIVKSANTEYVECRICDDVAQTQNTPHPVYTDNKGNEVIQMNAVVIGGNGLNA